MKQIYFTRAALSCVFTFFIFLSLHAQVFISEFHYDNTSDDVNESIEVSGDAGIDLNGYSIVLYNGSNDLSYNTNNISGVIPNEGGSGFGSVCFAYPENGIQNGPDAIALVDPNGIVLEFISYEGIVDASNGPASGMTSVNIGVSETSSTPIGLSLQLTDAGWSGPSAASCGLINIGLTLGQGPIPSVGFDNNTSSVTETDSPVTVDIPVTLSNYDGNPVVLDVTVGAGGTAESGDYIL